MDVAIYVKEMKTRKLVELINQDWRYIYQIPEDQQQIPVLMRCVKNMLNIPDETEYEYEDEKILVTNIRIYCHNYNTLRIMKGMAGLCYSS